MTAYCTQADLVERYGTPELGQLTDEAAATTPDAVEIAKICDEASSLIDIYLSARYATPIDPVPTMVRGWACIITRKMLWKDRADSQSPVILAYNDAMQQLKDVAKGLADLPDSDGVKEPTTGGIAYTTPSPVFNTDGLLD